MLLLFRSLTLHVFHPQRLLTLPKSMSGSFARLVQPTVRIPRLISTCAVQTFRFLYFIEDPVVGHKLEFVVDAC